MGLDFNNSDVHWSYGGFNDFRFRLASSIGVDLHKMRGFGGSKEWSEIDDPLVPFLNHSDCDGLIKAKDCEAVGKRMLKLVKNWVIDEAGHKLRGEQFAKDLIKCGKAGKPMKFE